MVTVQTGMVIRKLKKTTMVFSDLSKLNCFYNYVEDEFECDDEETELLKKVMGFSHFDTTKVVHVLLQCCTKHCNYLLSSN